ncbi:hypothetical protein D1006_40665 [Burkholderia stabilis]|uniref:Uncharacterized protein n=1 Tax=Burkholderia stabilis TaxID=95485 RepID=A0A4Q2A4Z9_9BURK|nr:hypothetical protein [Burkholderia stabilis]RXV64233.1 hypothetical protein D1006_40665 [Burkholderia stabilis]
MSEEAIHKTSEVYGISRDLPLNYVTRKSADDALIENLTRDKHLVIFGSSKQGKTSLRKHCLNESDYIIVHCSNRWSLEDLHSAILKRAGFELTQSNTKTETGKSKVLATLKATFLGTGVETSGELAREVAASTTTTPLELDMNDVNDIIKALAGFNRYIVLEDFHYLTVEAQRDFSVALKAFHEQSKLCFIIVGVWLEEGRLTVYNGDLTGRIFGINADKWSRDELMQVIGDGEALLNIQFSDDFKQKLLDGCLDSVYMVQEACYQACQRAKVYETVKSSTRFQIPDSVDVLDIIKEVVNQQTGRYNSFITQFAAGFQQTTLEMYRWLLYPVLTANVAHLEDGLGYREIRTTLQAKHPMGKDLNAGNVTQALQFVTSLQNQKDIKPIVLDYDQTNIKMNIVDLGFLIWLNNQDRKELLDLAGLPTE